MAFHRIAIRTLEEASYLDALKAVSAEFISMLIFIFPREDSYMAFSKLTKDGPMTPLGLVAAALTHAFGLFVAVSVGANISSGHVNSAMTFGAFVRGNITLLQFCIGLHSCLDPSLLVSFLSFPPVDSKHQRFSISSNVPVWKPLASR